MTPHAPTTIPEPAPAAPVAPVAPPPTRERTPQDVLLAAARYIEEHGWCQGELYIADGRVCVRGAMFAVTNGLDEPPSTLFKEASRLLKGSLRHHEVAWNDDPGRTEAEVLRALRDAAREPLA